MSKKDNSDKFQGLREKAERILDKMGGQESNRERAGDVKQLLHELSVSQIELELQNDELERSREFIERSRDKYQQLFDFAPIGYFTFDPDGLILDANLAATRLLGVERSYLYKRPFMTYLDKESQNVFYSHRIEAFETAFPQACELVVKPRGREARIVRMDSLAVPDDIGEYTSCLSAVADITEQRIAESNLERSRTEFKTLAENLPDIVIRFDERLRVLFMTPSVESVTGLHHGQYIGRSPREIGLPPELAAEWEKLLERVFKSGSEEEFEFCLDGLKGKMFYSARVVPERINGAIKSVLFVARDLSDRRRMEKELMAAKTSAEDANKAKSEFLANMSHEIRTPISGILGVTEMIISRSRDPEQEKYLRMVKESATLLMGVVNDILDFSKIEARKLDLEEHEFSPREMLEKILEPFRLQAKSKKLNLELTVDENVPEEVYGDARRIGQVIMNLVSNALKFTEEGGVSVSAGKPEGGSDRGMLQFSVRDTGIGIPLEQQKRLFQSFTQLDSSTSKKFQGTGLGLAICRQLVELMGGSIWVESKNGAGSAFHFTVALGKAELRPERQEAEEKAGKTRDFSGLRVLLAEDNILNQTFVVHFLQRAGHSVEAVSDGNEALRALDEKDFDIVLMDVQMPRLDGVEATSRIRSSGKPYSDVPIVALTAYAMSGDRERFIQAGMNDYVTKPIDMDRLLGIIHNSVNKESPSN